MALRSPASGYRTLELTRRGRCLTIALARVQALNAVDAEMHTELARVFVAAADDDAVDVIVLTGNGRAFCAGGDLQWQREAMLHPASFRRTVREARQIVFGMLDCDKPIIAKVNGAAVGLGATLALLADATFMAEDSFLADPHVNVGMTAGDGGAAIWPQLIGYMRAKHFLLTGERVPATDAERLGLVTAAVPRAQLDRRVGQYCRRLLSLPQQAIRSTKTAINLRLRELVTTSLDASLALESMANLTADHHEAVTAYLEKRQPRFRRGGDTPLAASRRRRARH